METRLTQFGRRVSNLGISLSLALSIPLQLATGAIIKAFGDIEAAALDASSLMKGVSADMGQVFAKLAMNMSMEFPFAPDEILKGVAEIERAGYTAKEAWGLIPGILKAAVAGNTEVIKTSEQVSGVMTTYGMKVNDTNQLIKNQATILDVLQMAANETNANFDEMVEGVIAFGPRARALGIDIYEAASVIGQFHQNLIKASKSGTYFDMSMRDIIRMFNKNKEVWMGPPFNLNIYDSAGQIRNFSSIILDLESSIAGLNDEAKFTALALLGLPDRSLKATLALIGQANAAKQLENQLRSAGGTIQDIYDVKMQGLNNQLTLLGNHFTRAGQALAMAFIPMVTRAAEWARLLLIQFTSLSAATQRSIALWALFGIAIGPVLIVLGMLLSSIQLLITPIILLVTWVGNITLAFMGWIIQIAQTAFALGVQLYTALSIAVAWMARMFLWTILMMVQHGIWPTILTILRLAFLATFGPQALLMLVRFAAQFALLARFMGTLGAVVFLVATAYQRLGISMFLARMLGMGLRGIAILGIVALGAYALHASGIFERLGNMVRNMWNSIAGTAGDAMTAMTDQMSAMTAAMSAEMNKAMADMQRKMGTMNGEMEKKTQAMRLLQAQIFQDYGGIDTMIEKIAVLNQALKDKLIDDIDYHGYMQMLNQQGAAVAPPNLPGTDTFTPPPEDKKNINTVTMHPYSATEFGTTEEYKARVGGQQAMLKVNQQMLAEHKKTNTRQERSNVLLASINTHLQNAPELVPVNS